MVNHNTLLLLLPPLLLTALIATVHADSASVHGVSVSVRSTRSIRYHGMQVPLFVNAGSSESERYFFPPLALLDCGSTRISTNDDTSLGSEVESNSTASPLRRRTLLHLTVLLWTDEFLSAAQAQLVPDANTSAASVHVELLPLTELTLQWSEQAARWLGKGNERRFRLLDEWIDAQKPRARATFTIACDLLADCRTLHAQLGDTDGSAGHLFDLKYRIRCDSQQRVSVPLASRHLDQSSLFQRLRRFGVKSSGIVFASEATVNQLAEEMRRAALDEIQKNLMGEQRFHSVDPEALASLLTDAGRLLRQAPVTIVGATQWAERVFWEPSLSGGAGLRPDRLAGLLNRLLEHDASRGPRHVQPKPRATALLAELASEGDLPPLALTAIRSFLSSRSAPDSNQIDVDEVRELAATLGSAVVWDAATIRFVPSTSVQLYELDTGRLKQIGTFAVRDAVLRYRVSEQRDHVTPLCRAVHGSADFTEESWSTQAELLGRRLKPLLRREANVSAELQRLEAALEAAKAESMPDTSVRQRSSDSESASELRRAIGALRSRIEALSDSITRSEAEPEGAYQKQFASSFCVLANTGPLPRGMTCRTISFVIPKGSLKANRHVRVGTGIAGQSLIQPMGKNFYRVQLRGCCK